MKLVQQSHEVQVGQLAINDQQKGKFPSNNNEVNPNSTARF